MNLYSVESSDFRQPIVGNIPHSGIYIPADVSRTFLLDEASLSAFLGLATDWYTDQLFSAISSIGGVSLISNVSRLVVDTERYEIDSEEPQAANGLGVIYTSTYTGQQLRALPSPFEREQLLQRYYRPYHAELTRIVSECLEKHQRCCVIDCHSFAGNSMSYDAYSAEQLPDICLGTDSHHTPPELVELLIKDVTVSGYSVAVNKPYSGTLVPLSFYGCKGVSGIMIEVNKRIYLEDSCQPSSEFANAKALVRKLIHRVSEFMGDY
jgi:N-formylglutamate deformylase